MKITPLVGTCIAAIGLTSNAVAADYQVTVTNLTSGIHFTPLIIATHDPSVAMFKSGTRASTQLQAIAEGGDTSGMATLLESIGAGVAGGTGLIAPSGMESFTISGNAGDVLSVAGMLLPTNDGFVGLNSVKLPMDNGMYAFYANGYDAGTEGNDERVGSGAPGEAGFPAPPPIVATGTGTGASGIQLEAEGYVHIHRNVIGDLDPTGGPSDINAAVHRWLNPVAKITVQRMDDGSTGGGGDSVSAVSELTGTAYSASALEIFWQPASSTSGYITSYEVRRNGNVVATTDGLSYFDDELNAGTAYEYTVVAMDSTGHQSAESKVTVSTNAR